MTSIEEPSSRDPVAFLRTLPETHSERRLQLFACAVMRNVWICLLDERSRSAVVSAERFADGEVSADELRQACWGAYEAYQEIQYRSERAAYDDPEADVSDDLWTAAASAANAASSVAQRSGGDPRRELREFVLPQVVHFSVRAAAIFAGYSGVTEGVEASQKGLMRRMTRCVFGATAELPAGGEAFVSNLVRGLAHAAYDDRHVPTGDLDAVRLNVLADALEDACADASLISHLREPGPHVRGCWAIDAVLGRA